MKTVDEKGHQYFTIRLVAALIRDGKCLIMRYADTYKKNMWGFPGGRMDADELPEESFIREMKEETGIDNFKILGTVDYDLWYHPPKHHPAGAIIVLIENDNDEIKMSEEHDKIAWVTAEEVDNYDFIWPQGTRMVKKAFEYYKLLNK
ncbi:NUDIX domain-containing protein [bacterium]|nr:NUDIX domain-containing protein [bacterium]